jgi:predicted DCC family thiol-disulfide oxidoreductase YuxK/uncharacterized membrane protein YphA (DoxX/SURF4 family)
MKHGWTGGQYSLWRGVLGIALAVHCAHRCFAAFAASDASLIAIVVLVAEIAASIALALGVRHRSVAVWLAAALVLNRDARFSDDAERTFLLAALLALCACTRPAPYGSLAAIGRADPGGSWILPDWVYACGWILLSAACLNDLVPCIEEVLGRGAIPAPVDVAWRYLGWIAYLAPLAIARRWLPWTWLALLAIEIAVALQRGDAQRFPLEIALLFGATFDPGWIPPRSPRDVDAIFYDGECGLCHRLVRFLLAEDRRGSAFRFAPLQGARARDAIAPEVRATLPDSLIVLTADGRLLARSRATRHALARLGGVWRAAAIAARVVPVAWLDRLYDLVARTRHALFAKPSDACPLSPPHLRRRFDE